MPRDYYHDVARWEGEGGSHGELIAPLIPFETQMNGFIQRTGATRGRIADLLQAAASITNRKELSCITDGRSLPL